LQQNATLRSPAFLDLNVLPEKLRPRRHPTWYIAGVAAMLALIVLLLPVYRAEQAGGEETALLQAELEMAKQELAGIETDFGRARAVRQELESAEAAIAGLSEERQTLLANKPELSIELPAMVLALPPGASLGSITGSSDGQLTLTGQAGSAADVIEYGRALVRGGRFSQAQITSLAVASGSEGGSGVTFTLEVTR
jgi:Tfp pilus assembly protein PilN